MRREGMLENPSGGNAIKRQPLLLGRPSRSPLLGSLLRVGLHCGPKGVLDGQGGERYRPLMGTSHFRHLLA